MKLSLPAIVLCIGWLSVSDTQAQSFNPRSRSSVMPSRSNPANFNPSRNERVQRIEAIKVGYITRSLNLTPEESESFWPIYNQYQGELVELNRQRREHLAQNLTPEQKTDEQFKHEQRVLDLRKRYRNEFKKVLPPEKITQLYQSEKEFKNELIRQLKERN